MKVIEIDPRECTKWKYADRSHFEFGNTDQLAIDIMTNGQINPVYVRSIKDSKFKYEVIAGNRRLRACLDYNIMIKAVVCNISDDQAATIQIKENDKLPLSEYSKGLSFAKLKRDKKFTQDQLANITGYSKNKIQTLLAFEKVDDKIWQAVQNMSKVSSKSAETILNLSNKSKAHKDALIQIADEIKKGIGRRNIEKLVNNIVHGENHQKQDLIQTSSGKILAKWNNNNLVFEKDLHISKKKINNLLVKLYDSTSKQKQSNKKNSTNSE